MNIKILLRVLVFIISPFNLIAQDASNWDKDRVTTKEILLSAGSKTWRRIDLPTGTIEVAVRITLLDDNQQLASSFSDLLSGIPLASAQVASASVNFLSEVVGEDYCRYYVFLTGEDGNNYIQTADYTKACYSNPIPINRDVVFLKGDCLQDNPDYLYFAFSSTNILQNERIVLEVIPWVDSKASKGWSRKIKQDFINNCKGIEEMKEVSDPEEYCQCLLDKFQENYTLQQFQQLIPSEKNKIAVIYGKQCLSETGADQDIYNNERRQAEKLAKDGKYGEAISAMIDIISSVKPTTSDYNNLGYYYIFSKQYLKAIKYLKEGVKLDDTDLLIQGNLAHAYLFNGDVEQAKVLYIKYKTQNVDDKMSWVEMIKLDFDDFKKAGLPSDNFQSILDLIK
jgi:hypothetical protein